MNNNEETEFGGQEQKQQTQQKVNNEWRKVTISGVTGILIGTGATSAVYEMKADDKDAEPISESVTVPEAQTETVEAPKEQTKDGETEDILLTKGSETETIGEVENAGGEPEEVVVHVYHHNDVNISFDNPQPTHQQPVEVKFEENGMMVAHVDDSMSFGDAFATARAQVGAGGAFHWHGGIYSTYYESEWNGMSDFAKQEYANRVSPEVNQESAVSAVSEISQPEVHFLGAEHVEIPDGTGMNVGVMSVDDTKVAFIDSTDDGVYNIGVADSNHNGEIETEEVKDISDLGLTVEQFAQAAHEQNEELNSLGIQESINAQNVDSEAQQDFVNDVDLQTI